MDTGVTSLEQWKIDHRTEEKLLEIPLTYWSNFWLRVTLPSYWAAIWPAYKEFLCQGPTNIKE